MNDRRFKHEGWLYALAFAVALFLRLIRLGALPLGDAEAASALQALALAQGDKPALGAHPLYVLSSAVLFFLYGGGTNFLARLVPALAGSLLVFLPPLFAPRRIKPRAAVILAFCLALDPGLASLSRQAASPILALTSLLFALGFFHQGKTRLAAIALALALLSGPAVWLGILGLAAAWGLLQLFERRAPTFSFKADFLFPFLATFFLAGSLFFIAPNGLSAALSSIPAFFSRWTFLSQTPPTRLLFSLMVYQPLGVLMALTAFARGLWTGSRRIILLSAWFGVALLLAIFLPAREMSDLIWALIPLWTLAAFQLTRQFNFYPEERVEIFGAALLTVFICAFIWLDAAGMAVTPLGDAQRFQMRLWLLGGSAALLALSLALIAAGWSLRVAQFGGLWGLTLGLGLLGLSGAFGAAGLRGTASVELWNPADLPAQAALLESSVSDLSEWSAGHERALSVTVVGVDSPALTWALRERPVLQTEVLDVSSAPAFVITPLQNNPALASAYRGQDFVWRRTPLWQTALPADWLRWVALREIPQAGETVILWAREDLFINSPRP